MTSVIVFTAGFLDNIHRSDDMIVVTHCPETPNLPVFKFKSKHTVVTAQTQ